MTLDPRFDGSFAAYRNTALSNRLFARACEHLDGARDEHYVSVRRLLRRIGGAEYEALILHALSPDDLDQTRTGILSSIFTPSPAVMAQLEHLAVHGFGEAGDDGARRDLWRVLLALDPERWHPRLIALLAAEAPDQVLLGMNLLPDFVEDGDQAQVLACLQRSAPGSAVEAGAMSVATTLRISDPAITSRAIVQLAETTDEASRVGCLNVLLADRSPEGRAVLDAYLAPLETAGSWRSTDAEALSIRLSQGEAGEALWRAGERLMHRPSLLRENFVTSFAERDPARAMNVLLERAFAPPDILTSAQPDAITTLATLDKRLATQAFVQAWTDHEARRQYLARIVRHLDDEALQVMIDHLEDDYQHGSPTVAYRAACCELRRAHEQARPMLLMRFGAVDAAKRLRLCAAIGWLPDATTLLASLADEETDGSVRREADEVRHHWLRTEAAVAQFRATPTLETMEYAIEVVDPAVLCGWEDPFRIIELIRSDARLIEFAELQLARRLNDVEKTNYKRVRVRRRVTDAA